MDTLLQYVGQHDPSTHLTEKPRPSTVIKNLDPRPHFPNPNPLPLILYQRFHPSAACDLVHARCVFTRHRAAAVSELCNQAGSGTVTYS